MKNPLFFYQTSINGRIGKEVTNGDSEGLVCTMPRSASGFTSFIYNYHHIKGATINELVDWDTINFEH